MPKTYEHLSIHEREQIAIYKGQGKSLREIARLLGRDPSTVSRELRRNAPPVYTGYYSGYRAHQRARLRNRQRHRRPRLKNDTLRHFVEEGLRTGWSPEIIAGRWRLETDTLISHEAIYQWIYHEARCLIGCLARAHRKRKNRASWRKRRCHIPGRVSIYERPAHVATRRQFGHWETDTMISRASSPVLQVTVERKTRYTIVKKLRKRNPRQMSDALVKALRRYLSRARRSITYDNGSENVEHARTNRLLGTRSYFCEPFHSWERGTAENTIGLIRRFFPKKTDFSIVSLAAVQSVQDWLNNRPRKCLGFRTPAEVFRPARVALAP